MTRWSIKIALLLLPAVVAALQLPSPIISPAPPNELSRRSAVSLLITSSSAAVSSAVAPRIASASASADAAKGGDVIGSIILNSNNKKTFPLASFGLQIYDDDTAYRLTLMALEVGYRNFFASVLAGNQRGFAKVSFVSVVFASNVVLIPDFASCSYMKGGKSLRHTKG